MDPIILITSRNGTVLKDYIEFIHGKGCYSFAGREGQRQQTKLAAYCAEEHTLIHEVSFFNSTMTILRIFSDPAFTGSFT